MPKIRRRAYPHNRPARPDAGRRGNARGKSSSGSKGQSGKGQQLPNKPRRG
jgi:hypothetical protein